MFNCNAVDTLAKLICRILLGIPLDQTFSHGKAESLWIAIDLQHIEQPQAICLHRDYFNGFHETGVEYLVAKC